jgi:hypothetical protein
MQGPQAALIVYNRSPQEMLGDRTIVTGQDQVGPVITQKGPMIRWDLKGWPVGAASPQFDGNLSQLEANGTHDY